MTDETDLEYSTRREHDERVAANNAADQASRNLHNELANYHAQKAKALIDRMTNVGD